MVGFTSYSVRCPMHLFSLDSDHPVLISLQVLAGIMRNLMFFKNAWNTAGQAEMCGLVFCC